MPANKMSFYFIGVSLFVPHFYFGFGIMPVSKELMMSFLGAYVLNKIGY